MVDLLPLHEVKFNHPEIITPISPPPEELKHYINDLDSLESDDDYLNQPPSLETLLSGLSKAPYSRVSFMSYLKSRHCSENLEFLMNSNQYVLTTRKLQSNIDTANYDFIQNERSQLWTHIFKQFISHDSPKEVNIPSDLKSQLVLHFQSNSLPQVELIETTMFSIKDLLRDTYFQFISHVKRSSPQYEPEGFFNRQVTSPERKTSGEISDNYCLLPKSSNDVLTPGFRRPSEICSPLDETNQTPFFDQSNTSRSQSPLSCESAVIDSRSNSSATHETVELSRPKNNQTYSSAEELGKKGKNSFSEAGVGFKKFAGRLRWRRLSSNSSTSSN